MNEKGDIGVIGGTFDPIHYGHLRAAEEVRFRLGLHQVLFIPAALPPHKLAEPLSEPEHRLEMVRRATAGNPGFSVSDVEICTLEKPSYTVKTIEHLRSRSPGELFLIVGMDSFREVPTWRDFRRIFALCHVVVVSRPGFSPTERFDIPSELCDLLTRSGEDRFVHTSGKQVVSLTVTGYDISSTRVRELVRGGKSIRYLVPPEVEGYIREKRLYQETG